MGLGTRKIKAEMRGTGGGRWMPRADAKKIANKARRAEDKRKPRPLESSRGPTNPQG